MRNAAEEWDQNAQSQSGKAATEMRAIATAMRERASRYADESVRQLIGDDPTSSMRVALRVYEARVSALESLVGNNIGEKWIVAQLEARARKLEEQSSAIKDARRAAEGREVAAVLRKIAARYKPK